MNKRDRQVLARILDALNASVSRDFISWQHTATVRQCVLGLKSERRRNALVRAALQEWALQGHPDTVPGELEELLDEMEQGVRDIRDQIDREDATH